MFIMTTKTITKIKTNVNFLLKGSSVNSCKPFEKAKEEYYRTFGYGKGVEDPTDVIMDAVS